jgi:cobalt-zinc-cadmium efflux system membrane fusion protein
MKAKYIVLLSGLLAACTPAVPEKNEIVEEHEENINMVELTDRQIEAVGIKVGGFSQVNLAEYIQTNGVFDVPPSNRASVNTPQRGFIKDAQHHVGNRVVKGEVLAIIEHPDFIQLQQNYLESVSTLRLLTKDVQRQQELAAENVNSQKQLQQAETEYDIAKAKVTANAERLKYLGISIADLEKGVISSSIKVKAPISGYIIAADVYKGKFMTPEEPLYEIIDNDHLHAEFNVFEKDMPKVKVGQKISFTVPAFANNIKYMAELHLINRTFDMDSKTVLIHGHLIDKNPNFIRGLYIEGKIWTKDQTLPALPNEAIISSGGLNYIFVKDHEEDEHMKFRLVAVKLGLTDGEFTQITPIDDLEENSKIVIEGAYYLIAELKKGEGGDDH